MKFSQAVTSGFVAGAALVLTAGSVCSQTTPQQPITQNFDSLDADGDGYITRNEADGNNVLFHFPAIDRNKDRVVSKEEFERYIVEEEPLLGEQLPLEELPQAHLRERVEEGSDPSVVTNPELLPRIKATFADLDENGNEVLTREEVRGEAIHRHFEQIDINSDSRITDHEFDRYVREWGTQVVTEDVMAEELR